MAPSTRNHFCFIYLDLPGVFCACVALVGGCGRFLLSASWPSPRHGCQSYLRSAEKREINFPSSHPCLRLRNDLVKLERDHYDSFSCMPRPALTRSFSKYHGWVWCYLHIPNLPNVLSDGTRLNFSHFDPKVVIICIRSTS